METGAFGSPAKNAVPANPVMFKRAVIAGFASVVMIVNGNRAETTGSAHQERNSRAASVVSKFAIWIVNGTDAVIATARAETADSVGGSGVYPVGSGHRTAKGIRMSRAKRAVYLDIARKMASVFTKFKIRRRRP
ncbi:MAG: hypothetical protein CMH52_06220 [Myxococcales bacterium]|mgnify:CR=1 FL=1|nr:hypothetical protein [Myxococcales bacterium]|tara:strand:- start:1946 stop:2350 length:405 start_codon:yes stop_codon:yes gene_type:complete